jgi:hypothetical protein
MKEYIAHFMNPKIAPVCNLYVCRYLLAGFVPGILHAQDGLNIGTNSADMYGFSHIQHMLRTFPAVFSGMRSFPFIKESVSAKISGEVEWSKIHQSTLSN